ncbi:Ankyrin-3 [Porphyridium purpureum]|uniref:Ankyrin-3 n=1 Tax=Porphyridium purpureum TaxID=35688 RepID=A0A5J4Z2H9_PORPP|nr:Ankyrin-3 [Porphyridium purpureum]|eukprot:POR1989..scf295_1
MAASTVRHPLEVAPGVEAPVITILEKGNVIVCGGSFKSKEWHLCRQELFAGSSLSRPRLVGLGLSKEWAFIRVGFTVAEAGESGERAVMNQLPSLPTFAAAGKCLCRSLSVVPLMNTAWHRLLLGKEAHLSDGSGSTSAANDGTVACVLSILFAVLALTLSICFSRSLIRSVWRTNGHTRVKGGLNGRVADARSRRDPADVQSRAVSEGSEKPIEVSPSYLFPVDVFEKVATYLDTPSLLELAVCCRSSYTEWGCALLKERAFRELSLRQCVIHNLVDILKMHYEAHQQTSKEADGVKDVSLFRTTLLSREKEQTRPVHFTPSVSSVASVGLFDASLEYLAALFSEPATLRWLLERGGDANAASCSDFSRCALHAAVRARSLQKVDLLLRFGAQIDAEELHGRTPLMEAASYGLVQIGAMLCERGADTERQDLMGQNALHIACRNLQADFCRFLLETVHMDANVSDHHGLFPLHVCAQLPNCSALISHLVQFDADPNLVDHEGWTPLAHAFCSARDPSVVRALLKHTNVLGSERQLRRIKSTVMVQANAELIALVESCTCV